MISVKYSFGDVLLYVLRKYQLTFLAIIIIFGVFAIGSMTYNQSPIEVAAAIFAMYFILSVVVMLILISIYAVYLYITRYKDIDIEFTLTDDEIIIKRAGEVFFQMNMDNVVLIHKRKYLLVDTIDGEVEFMTNDVYKALVEQAK